MKKCKWCGKEFEPINSEQKFCSRDCSYFYDNTRAKFEFLY